jgi:hypothetical protein
MSETKRVKALKNKDKDRNKRRREQNLSFLSHRKIIGEKIAEETDRACNDY